jgi:hypothetical protein
MKGVKAQELLDVMIEALHDHLPPGVRTVRTKVGVGGGLQIWPVPSGVPADVDYGFWDVRVEPTSGQVEQRGPWLPWGLGGWAWLPRRLRMRLAAVEALESIQEAVQGIEPTWPALDAKVKARVEQDQIVVWFHSLSGGALPPPLRLTISAFH